MFIIIGLLIASIACWTMGNRKAARALALLVLVALIGVIAGANIGSSNGHGQRTPSTSSVEK